MGAPPERTYWVLPDQVLAGPFPGSPWPGERPPLLIALLELGFSFFIDLTEPHENDTHPYEDDLPELAAQAGHRAVYHRRSVPDYGTPTVGQMHEILALIDTALEEGRRVYLHCFAGVGRSATVAGCYLVHRGYSPRRALKTLNPEGRGILTRRRPRPGTPEQRQMVETWNDEEQTAGQ